MTSPTPEEALSDLVSAILSPDGIINAITDRLTAIWGTPEPYTDEEAAAIRLILASLTAAQIKDRFEGYGVRRSTMNSMRKGQIIDYLIETKYVGLDGMPAHDWVAEAWESVHPIS